MHFVPWWTAPPTIVAEALAGVPDPLLTALRPGPAAPAGEVATSLAHSLAPVETSVPAPRWLLRSQHSSFRRTVAALTTYRGALLADAVGSGKTYIALAVAATLNEGRCTACLVPATLLPKWAAVAKALDVPVCLCSHEQTSRGHLPEGSHGVVIIDESHHFRTRSTKRYAFVADWLLSRSVLLVTATPIVNFLSDLGNQLHLAVRDNVLAYDGIQSLRSLFASGESHPALGQLVTQGDGALGARPRKLSSISVPAPEECIDLDVSARLIGRLQLSSSESVAGLVRGVLLRAAASSPAALASSLQRYQKLLLNARDALRAGRVLDRSQLRRFTAELGDQLVWWELLLHHEESSDLQLADLDVLNQVIPIVLRFTRAHDAKLCRLMSIMKDEKVTLVFTGSRDTVRYIRSRIADVSLAWCTGHQAGIGRTAMPRDSVLGWFRDGAPSGGPRHLIVTDVAAEGLDLQRAARVIHYDLPWTPTRLEQREGRSIRLGSCHPQVEVVRFAPPANLERCLGVEATLARKQGIPAVAGLGHAGHNVWRWRADIAGRFGEAPGIAGTAAVDSDERGLLVGIALYTLKEPAVILSTAVGWLDRSGAWSENAKLVTGRLVLAATQHEPRVVDPDELRTYLELLTPLIRSRLALTRGRRWLAPDPGPSARVVAERLGQLIRQAARLRQDARLSELEAALAFVSGGHTAGEERLIEMLAEVSDRELVSRLSGVLPQPAWHGIEARLTGLIIFRPGA